MWRTRGNQGDTHPTKMQEAQAFRSKMVYTLMQFGQPNQLRKWVFLAVSPGRLVAVSSKWVSLAVLAVSGRPNPLRKRMSLAI